MSSNVVNAVAYLRVQREFPMEANELSVELDKAYVDIANAVNNRIISIFPTNRPAITGEAWFVTKNQKQQTFRQVYTFTTAPISIPHGINIASISRFSRGFGSYTDGTNHFGVIFGSSNAIAGQVSFYVTATNIVVLLGAGAPAVTSGIIVIEWMSEP